MSGDKSDFDPKLNFAWLLINSKCNLRCSYCYENKYGFKNEEMSVATLDSAMSYIDKNCAEGSEIGIYGGEPLISFNLIKYLFDTYPNKNYSLFTNTILMTDGILDFLSSRQDFLIMDISLDGDYCSQVKNRGVMYDEFMVRKILKTFRHTGVRMIVTEPERCYDNCSSLVSLGAKRIDLNYPNFTVFPDNVYISEINKQLDRIRNDTLFKNVKITEPYYCTEQICEIGSKRVAIVPNGDIYPCDVFYFVDRYRVGDIFNGIDRTEYIKFVEDVKFLKSKDRPCPAHNYCMGNKCSENLYMDLR
jgi:uncharacterized protein